MKNLRKNSITLICTIDELSKQSILLETSSPMQKVNRCEQVTQKQHYIPLVVH